MPSTVARSGESNTDIGQAHKSVLPSRHVRRSPAPPRGLRDELDLIINNLSSRDSKVAPHQEDDCSAAGVDLAEQLSTVRRHYNRLLRDMQAIANERLPAGMTASDFAAAAIAGALSPQVVHPRSGE